MNPCKLNLHILMIPCIWFEINGKVYLLNLLFNDNLSSRDSCNQLSPKGSWKANIWFILTFLHSLIRNALQIASIDLVKRKIFYSYTTLMTIYNTLKSEYHWLTYIWPVSANLFEKNFSSHFLIRINSISLIAQNMKPLDLFKMSPIPLGHPV